MYLMAKSDEDFLQQNTHRSPASSLPPDILSLIFQHACTIPDLNKRYGLPELTRSSNSPPSKEKFTQFILSAVSVYWRQVSTLLTPYIWTSVDLTVSSNTVDKASAVLQAFFSYSGQLPLAIAIDFDKSWARNIGALVDTSSDVVLHKNTHRIHELYLHCLPDTTWIDFLPSLSNLIHLSIQHNFHIYTHPPLLIKSHCSTLTLRPFPGSVRLSCPELTLRLQGADVDFCLEILMVCRNLIEFRVQEPEDEGGREELLPTSSLVLPNMKIFEWSVNTAYLTDRALLEHVRMPALRELVWVEESHESLRAVEPLDTFFSNLPSTLIHLHIHHATVTQNTSIVPASVLDYVRDSHNIEYLTLSGVTGVFLDHVFERLTPILENSGSRKKVKLPKLKAILIKEISGPNEFSNLADFPQHIECNQGKILQMLEHRFLYVGCLNHEPFRLDFPPKVALLPEFKEKLGEMIGRGLKVEISEGGKSVGWL